MTMQRVTIEISNELLEALQDHQRASDSQDDLATIVEAALNRFLTDQDAWGGREYRHPTAPLRISPTEQASGLQDVSIDHDRYLAEQ